VRSRSIRKCCLLPLTLKLISVSALVGLLACACPLDSVFPTVSCTMLGSEACCNYKVAFVLRAKASLPLSALIYSTSSGVHTSGEDNYDHTAFLLLPYPTPSYKPDVTVLVIETVNKKIKLYNLSRGTPVPLWLLDRSRRPCSRVQTMCGKGLGADSASSWSFCKLPLSSLSVAAFSSGLR